MKYGRLSLLEDLGRLEYGKQGQKQRYWKMQCDCGQELIVRTAHVKAGLIQSCRCLQRERASASNTKHGHSRPKQETATYRTWLSMLNRCYNQRATGFKYWGGRGIQVCSSWKTSYIQFLADMGERPSRKFVLDRIDNDGNYEPGNCQWITRVENAKKMWRDKSG